MKRVLSLLFVLLLSANTSALVKVNGAGASFPFPIYSKWFSEYKKVATDIEFNYQAIGSGGGIRQLIKQTVDFGASDAPMKEKDIKKAAWPVKHIPTVLGAVAVAYNLEIGEIKLDGQTLADIFMGKITKWNHPSIAKLNKNLTLPAKDILVVRRADGSGTTSIFSDYLSTISSNWEKNIGRGKSIKWPVGIGAKGNDGVTAIIKQTQGAIGYIELAYALKNNLNTVALKNDAGEFIRPSVEGVSLSADTLKGKDSKVTVSIVNAKGKGVYPISAFTYILLPVKKDTEQLKEVKKFLKWALTDGQKMATELHYAPLPKSLAKRMLKEL